MNIKNFIALLFILSIISAGVIMYVNNIRPLADVITEQATCLKDKSKCPNRNITHESVEKDQIVPICEP